MWPIDSCTPELYKVTTNPPLPERCAWLQLKYAWQGAPVAFIPEWQRQSHDITSLAQPKSERIPTWIANAAPPAGRRGSNVYKVHPRLQTCAVENRAWGTVRSVFGAEVFRRGNCSKVTAGSELWPPLIFFKKNPSQFFS